MADGSVGTSCQAFDDSAPRNRAAGALAMLLALTLAVRSFAYGTRKEKKTDATAPQKLATKFEIDTSKLVWPGPPSIARVRYLNCFAGMKIDYTPQSKWSAP